VCEEEEVGYWILEGAGAYWDKVFVKGGLPGI